MMRMTSFSFPGIVLEEKRKVSPSFSSIPRCFPREREAEAARRSPCDPVTISIRFSRGMFLASSGDTTVGKSDKTPVLIEASIMRRIARPRRQIDRPAACPAWASVLTRATFDAKVVATNMPVDWLTNLVISGPTMTSDRPG